MVWTKCTAPTVNHLAKDFIAFPTHLDYPPNIWQYIAHLISIFMVATWSHSFGQVSDYLSQLLDGVDNTVWTVLNRASDISSAEVMHNLFKVTESMRNSASAVFCNNSGYCTPPSSAGGGEHRWSLSKITSLFQKFGRAPLRMEWVMGSLKIPATLFSIQSASWPTPSSVGQLQGKCVCVWERTFSWPLSNWSNWPGCPLHVSVVLVNNSHNFLTFGLHYVQSCHTPQTPLEGICILTCIRTISMPTYKFNLDLYESLHVYEEV